MRHHLVVVITSSILMGLSLLRHPAGHLSARDTQQSWGSKGYGWCPASGTCADLSCGKSPPGSSFCSQGVDHPTKCYGCNGCTGEWELIGLPEPGTGLAPGAQLPPRSGTVQP